METARRRNRMIIGFPKNRQSNFRENSGIFGNTTVISARPLKFNLDKNEILMRLRETMLYDGEHLLARLN